MLRFLANRRRRRRLSFAQQCDLFRCPVDDMYALVFTVHRLYSLAFFLDSWCNFFLCLVINGIYAYSLHLLVYYNIDLAGKWKALGWRVRDDISIKQERERETGNVQRQKHTIENAPAINRYVLRVTSRSERETVSTRRDLTGTWNTSIEINDIFNGACISDARARERGREGGTERKGQIYLWMENLSDRSRWHEQEVHLPRDDVILLWTIRACVRDDLSSVVESIHGWIQCFLRSEWNHRRSREPHGLRCHWICFLYSYRCPVWQQSCPVSLLSCDSWWTVTNRRIGLVDDVSVRW